MHSAVRWFIHNPVAANLLMAFILFMGVMTTLTIRIEGFPKLPPEAIHITTSFSDATANQIDELVTAKIEKALEGLDGVRSIRSSSANGYSTVIVRRAGGQDLNRLLDKVRLRIDAIEDLPSKAERPVIDTDGFSYPALYLNLYGDTDPATLQTLAERLKAALLAREELSRLNIWGIQPREIHIEISPQQLRRHNLTLADVMARIRASSLDFEAGKLRTEGGTVLLRADNRAHYTPEFAAIPIIERPDGNAITLGQLAQISDTFAEGDYLFRFNGAPTTGMEVQVGQKENLLTISAVVHSVVDNFAPQLPPGINISIWGDSAGYIEDRLTLLQHNGIQGLLLVGLLLALFLNVRLAFWVALGIPISMMGAMAVAGSSWLDYSLNDVTTFGLIIVLGILVDDAVVVGESVFEQRRKQTCPIRGTVAGVDKVAVATVFGVLTTIAAFTPMLMIDNPLGKVLASFSGMVILALIFSLIESKFILPAHLAQTSMDTAPGWLLSRLWSRLQTLARAGLTGFRDHFYAPLLRLALVHRYAVLVLFISAATLGLGMIGLGKIRTVFFPEIPEQLVQINLTMDARAPFTLTRNNIEQIQQVGQQLNTRLQWEYALAEPPITLMFLSAPDAGSAELYAELSPVAQRPGLEAPEIARRWREQTGPLEGSIQLTFDSSEDVGGGFQLRLEGQDPQQLQAASNELKQYLAQIAGISELRDSMAGGQSELSIRLRPEARNLGFNTDTLASQIGYAFGGAEVQKLRRDGQQVKVQLHSTLNARDSQADLLQTRLRSSNGDWVALHALADIEGRYVAGTIHRRNGKRINHISASIDDDITSAEEVSQAVFTRFAPTLAQRYPGVSLLPAGELAEMNAIKGDLSRALIIASVMIYILMAVPLKSYWQPFVILSIVPFGFVGAAIGHLIMDLPLSLFSFFGMLALTGVVVNDSLVMMTRYNQARDAGLPLNEALHDAGTGRFNAIFLTTATTVIGLMPLLSETSEQAQYLIPAAASLAWGELFATTLMLILVPVLIAIIEDIRSLFVRY
ncbi:MAG: efflux RND transporter permease subunit [Marinobacterium sp.]|nr:efflux RND transporter permease subunit [Marinobacterium sp.]